MSTNWKGELVLYGKGRYRASPIQKDEHLLTCMRYVELSSLKACMVESIEHCF